MDSYVVDTSALLWHLTASRKLSRRAKAVFSAAEAGRALLYLPAIVIAELYFANVKEGRPMDFERVYHEIRSAAQFILLPFEADDALGFDRAAAVPEMHDRMIVVAAQRMNAPVLTADPVIAGSGLVRVVW